MLVECQGKRYLSISKDLDVLEIETDSGYSVCGYGVTPSTTFSM